MKPNRLFALPSVIAICLSGCSAIPEDISELAKENPLLAVAAGAAIGAVTVVSGGAALVGIGVAGAGLTTAYGIEKKMGSELDIMITNGDCEGVKAFATRNYYSPVQRRAVLEKACNRSAAPSSTATLPASTSNQSAAMTSNPKDVKTPDRQTIIWAQKALIRLELLASSPSGTMGPKTIDAIKSFQTSTGLPPTGQLDDQTIASLRLASRSAPNDRESTPEKSKPIPPPQPSPLSTRSLDSL